MSAAPIKHDEGRLAQVLVAPIISEKAKCCATPPSLKSRLLWS
jgi:hypothetical protein